MNINMSFKPWLTASKDRGGRPVLEGSYFDKEKGILVSTDGRMMGLTPVEAFEDDEPAIIPNAALKEAHKLAKLSKLPSYRIEVKDGSVKLADDRTFPIVSGQYPQYQAVLPKFQPTTKTARILLNPSLLAAIQESFGDDKAAALLEFEINDDMDAGRGPVSVTISGQYQGVIMPMRLDPRVKETAESTKGA